MGSFFRVAVGDLKRNNGVDLNSVNLEPVSSSCHAKHGIKKTVINLLEKFVFFSRHTVKKSAAGAKLTKTFTMPGNSVCKKLISRRYEINIGQIKRSFN